MQTSPENDMRTTDNFKRDIAAHFRAVCAMASENQRILAVGSVLLLACLALWPVWEKLSAVWSLSENYSHGIFIPFVSAYLLWDRREGLAGLPVRPSPWGAFLIISGTCLVLLGRGYEMALPVYVYGAGFMMGAGLILVLSGAVLLTFGSAVLRACAVPLAYLGFMLPLPGVLIQAITSPLKRLGAVFARTFLCLLGTGATREGSLVRVGSHLLDVTADCSGIRSLVVLIAAATAFCIMLLDREPLWKKVLVVASVLPAVVFINGLRTTAMGVIVWQLGPEIASGSIHDASGWIAFGLALGIVFASALLIEPSPVEREEKPRSDASMMQSSSLRGRQIAYAVATLLLLAAGGGLCYAARPRTAPDEENWLARVPLEHAGWRGSALSFDSDVERALRPSSQVTREYRNEAGQSVWFYAAFWKDPNEGGPHRPVGCYPHAGWRILHHDVERITSPSGRTTVVVDRLDIAKGDERRLVLYWYEVGSHILLRPHLVLVRGGLRRRLESVLHALLTRRANTCKAFCRLSVAVGPDPEAALRAEVALLRDFWPFLFGQDRPPSDADVLLSPAVGVIGS